MTTSGSGAVFFLGSRAHYQVLEQPNNFDAENGNASTETIYQNPSVEEIWPKETMNKNDFDANFNPDTKWSYNQNNEPCDNKTVVKRRVKRQSTEALLCDDNHMKPAVLNHVDCKQEVKQKPRRISLLSFLSSLARRKRRLESEQVQYLQHIESVLTNCTYRESCRCLDCQSRYFECAEESESYSSDDEYSFSAHDAETRDQDHLDDEVFLDSPTENDNASTDLLLPEEEPQEAPEEDAEQDKQLQMEVAASTSAMFNILLYHPFSCSIQ